MEKKKKTGGKKEQTSDTYRRLDLKKHDAERKTAAFTQLFHWYVLNTKNKSIVSGTRSIVMTAGNWLGGGKRELSKVMKMF